MGRSRFFGQRREDSSTYRTSYGSMFFRACIAQSSHSYGTPRLYYSRVTPALGNPSLNQEQLGVQDRGDRSILDRGATRLLEFDGGNRVTATGHSVNNGRGSRRRMVAV